MCKAKSATPQNFRADKTASIVSVRKIGYLFANNVYIKANRLIHNSESSHDVAQNDFIKNLTIMGMGLL